MADPDCWFCGQPIREDDPAESLLPSTVSVHAVCAERDVAGGRDMSEIGVPKAA